MRRCLSRWALAACLSCGAALAADIALPGDTYRDLAPKGSSGNWLALHRPQSTRGGWQLTPARVEVRPAARDSEFEVSIVSSVRASSYLFRDTPLSAGAVPAAEFDAGQARRIGSEVLASKDQRHVLRIAFQGARYELRSDWRRGTMSLRHQGVEQVLHAFPKGPAQGDPDNWALAWAGDLDRDGKLDLVLVGSDHQRWRHHVLFLSSTASPRAWVGKVASVRLGF